MNRRAFLRLSASVPWWHPDWLGAAKGLESSRTRSLVQSPWATPQGPWLTILAPGMVRLRFETLEDVSVPVVVEVDGERTDLFTETRTAEVTGLGLSGAQTIEDLPGDYTVHDVIIDGIPAGARLDWEVQRVPRARRCPIPRVMNRSRWSGWPTRCSPPAKKWPAWSRIWPTLSSTAATGYRSNPADTWNSFFGFLEPVMRTAPFHVCIGNYEFDVPRRPSSTTVLQRARTATRAGMPSRMAAAHPDA